MRAEGREHVVLAGAGARGRAERAARVEPGQEPEEMRLDRALGREQQRELLVEALRVVEVGGQLVRTGEVQIAPVEPRAERQREPRLHEGRVVALEPLDRRPEHFGLVGAAHHHRGEVAAAQTLEGVGMVRNARDVELEQPQEAAQRADASGRHQNTP
jgi:hypothetical protein